MLSVGSVFPHSAIISLLLLFIGIQLLAIALPVYKVQGTNVEDKKVRKRMSQPLKT